MMSEVSIPPAPISPLGGLGGGELGGAETAGRTLDDGLEVEVPSLQLQDVEGRIHKYEGPLSRKIKKAKLKHGWKKRWFRVSPGKNIKKLKLTVKKKMQLQGT